MAFTQILTRKISRAQSKYKIISKDTNQQSSYNLDLKTMNALLVADAIFQTEQQNHYEVVDGYEVKLSNGILKLIGGSYAHQKLNVKFIYTKSSDGTTKFQIKRKENNSGKYEWFIKLYDTNYEDSEFKMYLDKRK